MSTINLTAVENVDTTTKEGPETPPPFPTIETALADLEVEDILQAYVARQEGCRCGCKGRYFCWHVAEVGLDRGYDAGPDEVNVGRIRSVLKEIKEAPRSRLEFQEHRTKTALRDDGDHAFAPSTIVNLTREDGAVRTVYLRAGRVVLREEGDKWL